MCNIIKLFKKIIVLFKKKVDQAYFNQNFDKYILIDICKMSSDLEIIMMAASILEKSGFRLICLWC